MLGIKRVAVRQPIKTPPTLPSGSIQYTIIVSLPTHLGFGIPSRNSSALGCPHLTRILSRFRLFGGAAKRGLQSFDRSMTA